MTTFEGSEKYDGVLRSGAWFSRTPLRADEFMTLIEALEQRSFMNSTGLNELGS